MRAPSIALATLVAGPAQADCAAEWALVAAALGGPEAVAATVDVQEPGCRASELVFRPEGGGVRLEAAEISWQLTGIEAFSGL